MKISGLSLSVSVSATNSPLEDRFKPFSCCSVNIHLSLLRFEWVLYPRVVLGRLNPHHRARRWRPVFGLGSPCRSSGVPVAGGPCRTGLAPLLAVRPQLSEVDVLLREKRGSLGPLPAGCPRRSLDPDEPPEACLRASYFSE